MFSFDMFGLQSFGYIQEEIPSKHLDNTYQSQKKGTNFQVIAEAMAFQWP